MLKRLILLLIVLCFITTKANAAPSATVTVLAEFGEVSLTNNNYTTVNLSNTYTSPIVVATPRYTTSQTFRSVRIRNKTGTSFEIKVDNFNGTLTGSTPVDWLVFEAGDHNIDTGSGTTRFLAASSNVSTVACNSNNNPAGVPINFAPAFSTNPAVLHNVTSESDASFVFSSANDGSTRQTPVSATTMELFLQRSFESCTHGAEDIDYIVIEPDHGTNNSIELEAQLSTDTVSCCNNPTGYPVSFNTAFASAPQSIIISQNAEDGGNGGYALVHTGVTPTTTGFAASIDEDGTGADRTHTTEQVSVLAFSTNTGELTEVTSSPWNQDANLRLWLRAGSLGLVDGDPVSTWTDSSVNTNDLIQAGGLRPAYRDNTADNINFNPVIDFDGIDDFLEDADGDLYLNSQNAASIFFVIQSDSAASDVGFFRTENTASTDNGLSMRYDLAGFLAGGNNLIKFGDGSNPVVNGESSSNTQTTNPQLLDLFRDNGTAPRLFINGLQNTLANVPGNSGAMSGLDYVRVGDHGTGEWDGSVAEVLLYTEALDATDRLIVESYLAVKYGITLDQSGTGTNYLSSAGQIIFDADTAGAGSGAFNSFNNDIFGIGQDDSSLLNHSTSKSINSDAIITLSNPSALGDGDYLVIGNDNDNNGTIEEITTELAPNITSRLDREWKVDLSGSPGTVTVAFDLTGIAVSGTSANDFRLIVDSSDSDFSNGFSSAFKATSFTANILTFDNVNFADGTVFTVSTSEFSPGGAGGIELWYKANEQGLIDGNAVNNLDDASPGDNDALAGNAPVFRDNATDNINFNPIVEYNGTNDYLAIENISYTGTSAISNLFSCTVFRTSFSGSTYNDNWAFLDYDRSEYFNYYIRGDNGGIDFSYAAGGITDNSSTVTGYNDGAPHYACAFYDNTLTNETRLRADGQTILNTDAEPLSQTIGTANTRFGFIGDGSEAATFNAGRNNIFYEGDIAETVYYVNRQLSLQEMLEIESYIATKYGITLDQTGTGQNYFDSAGNIIFDADTAGAGSGTFNAYNDDIAAIGQDDQSTLTQTQSRSVNSDSLVTMSNASNLDNLEFLFWGNDNDDNGTVELTTAGTPTGVEQVLDRRWRVSETGELGTVTVSFDLSGLSLPPVTDPSDIKLIRDTTDADFSAGATTVDAQTFTNDIATFTLINFSDQEFFGLGFAPANNQLFWGMPF